VREACKSIFLAVWAALARELSFLADFVIRPSREKFPASGFLVGNGPRFDVGTSLTLIPRPTYLDVDQGGSVRIIGDFRGDLAILA
jgi:hypothetical protein